MTKPYLILVDGKLAARALTFHKAQTIADELKIKGYRKISIAHDLEVSR